MDDGIRTIVEKNADSAIKKPKVAERAYANILRSQGIEPNLETVLSFLMGHLTGIVDGMYVHKHKRLPTSDENDELNQLLKRRAWEIRQAFMSTRIE